MAGDIAGPVLVDDPERFAIEAVDGSNHPDVEALGNEVFTRQNPLLRELGVDAETWGRLEAWDTEGWDRSGCSLLMRDRAAGGRVVAFAVVQVHSFFHEPPHPTFFKDLTDMCPNIAILFSVAGPTIGEAWKKSGGIACSLAGRTLRFAAGGTREGYEGLGLQRRLRVRVMEMARERGYDRLVVETINPATQHLWRQFGCEQLAARPLSEGRLADGSQPFAGLKLEFTVQEKVFRRRPLRDSKVAQVVSGMALLSAFACKACCPASCSQFMFKVGCSACCCEFGPWSRR